MNIQQLIEILKTKDQSAEVEYIVVKTDGEVVTMDVSTQSKPLIKLLKMFG